MDNYIKSTYFTVTDTFRYLYIKLFFLIFTPYKYIFCEINEP